VLCCLLPRGLAVGGDLTPPIPSRPIRTQLAAEPGWRGIPEPGEYAADEYYIPVLEDDALLQYGELANDLRALTSSWLCRSRPSVREPMLTVAAATRSCAPPLPLPWS